MICLEVMRVRCQPDQYNSCFKGNTRETERCGSVHMGFLRVYIPSGHELRDLLQAKSSVVGRHCARIKVLHRYRFLDMNKVTKECGQSATGTFRHS